MIEGIRSSPQQEKSENKETLRAEEEERLSGMLSSRDREAQAMIIINTLDSFKILTHTEIALKMIEANQGAYVTEYFSNFEGLDHAEIALKMIEAGNSWSVAQNLSSFEGLDYTDIALKMIEVYQGEYVAEYLSNFEGLNHAEIALKMIEVHQGKHVARNLSNFKGLDHTDIALKMIEANQSLHITQNLSRFEGLDYTDIALKMIEAGDGWHVAMYLSDFEGLDHAEIALKLIEANRGKYVVENLYKFKGLSKKVAMALVDAGEGRGVAMHLSNFEGPDHTDIALKLIEAGEGRYMARHLSNFKELDHTEIALKLIEAGEGRYMARHLSNFKDLDHTEIALKMIEANQGEGVAENLPSFEGLDHTDTALKLIEANQGEYVAEYLSDFEGLSKKATMALVDAGRGRRVAENISNFEGLDHTEIALKIIEANQGEYVAKYLSDFEGLDHSDIIDALERNNQQHVVLWYCNRFSGAEKYIAGIEEDTYREAFEFGKEKILDLSSDTVITAQFQQAAEIFGYRQMFVYKEREGMSFHDAAHALNHIAELYEASGLSPDEFHNNILKQVQADSATYEEGTAHHYLNALAQSMNKDMAGVIKKIREYKEIDRLQELAHTLRTPQDVFASWYSLKQYREVEQLLDQAHILEELKELKQEGKTDLYRYIETLAFHPDSKVSMRAVLQFWRNPDAFLEAEASHTPSEVQNRKKPSNYTDIPNLDLTAEDLRDALVERKIDTLTVFTPLEIRYTVPLEQIELPPTREALAQAVGSRRNKIPGAAKNPGLLFSKVNALLKPHKHNTVKYLQGADLPKKIEKELEHLIYDETFGMQRPKAETQEYVASIIAKSDPTGAMAGNDTANCMPYGDGKNTVYTFNPNTAQFILRTIKNDGTERTIAQSVLTKDLDIHTAVPEVIKKLHQEATLKDVLPESILAEADTYLACDNIEVAPNYTDKKHQTIIENIYRDFFRTYLTAYGTERGFNTHKVPIGTGFSDALTDLPTERNTYIPQAPVSYSDKTGENVYTLELTEQTDTFIDRTITEHHTEEQKPQLPLNIRGLSYLTYEDSIKVGYLEGKAYADNTSLIGPLFAMENTLIAKDINNTAKGRPNMSIRYTDQQNAMQGYLLAYEGVIRDSTGDNRYNNNPCVYIADIAVNRQNRMAGGRLIQGFIQLYKQHYLDKGNPLPIYAQARETTSYPVIKKQLNTLGRKTNTSFELIELPAYTVNSDTMRPVIIQPAEG